MVAQQARNATTSQPCDVRDMPLYLSGVFSSLSSHPHTEYSIWLTLVGAVLAYAHLLVLSLLGAARPVGVLAPGQGLLREVGLLVAMSTLSVVVLGWCAQAWYPG